MSNMRSARSGGNHARRQAAGLPVLHMISIKKHGDNLRESRVLFVLAARQRMILAESETTLRYTGRPIKVANGVGRSRHAKFMLTSI